MVGILVKSQRRELERGRDIGKRSTEGDGDRWGYGKRSTEGDGDRWGYGKRSTEGDGDRWGYW